MHILAFIVLLNLQVQIDQHQVMRIQLLGNLGRLALNPREYHTGVLKLFDGLRELLTLEVCVANLCHYLRSFIVKFSVVLNLKIKCLLNTFASLE